MLVKTKTCPVFQRHPFSLPLLANITCLAGCNFAKSLILFFVIVVSNPVCPCISKECTIKFTGSIQVNSMNICILHSGNFYITVRYMTAQFTHTALSKHRKPDQLLWAVNVVWAQSCLDNSYSGH